ncbi:MAG: HPr family phosphocarrier protein [Gammaproteobacteria bacterium]|nr:HPr family phosphocarrier protein [Gammaproteobacteria bacterium]
MLEKEIIIINKLGLHARAAAKFVTTAGKYSCGIKVVKEQKAVDGKSIMGIMMLAAAKGTTLTLIADGEDEINAISDLNTLILDRFGEAE